MALPRLIIFDCDGVLVDSEPIAMQLLLDTLRPFGCELDLVEGYRLFLGRSLASCCEELRTSFGVDLTTSALEAMRAELYLRFRRDLRPIPGVREALAELRGAPAALCVASSSQPERLRLSLALTGLAGIFGEAVFSATQVRNGKPAPDLFLHAAAAMGARPADAVVIEDSPAGVRAARAAGMGVIGFTGGGHAGAAGLPEMMSSLAPDAVLTDMAALPDLLRGWRV